MALSKAQMRLFLHGSSGAQVHSEATPKQTRRLKRAARRRGVTLDGLVSGVPPALQERSRQGIVRQARQTVAQAYRPAFQELDEQTRQLRNLDAKRAADYEHYRSWLNTKQNELVSASKSYGDMVAESQRQIRADIERMYASATPQAVPGSVSLGGQNAQAMQQALEPSAVYANQLAVTQQASTNTARADDLSGLSAVALNNMAAIMADERRRQAGVEEQLGAFGIERRKLSSSRVADTRKEITRLFDQEISKANANREYSAIAAELGLKEKSLDLDAFKAKQDAKQDAWERRYKMSKEERRQMEADRAYQLDLDKFGFDLAVDRYMRRNKVGRYSPGGGFGKGGGLTHGQRNEVFGTIDRAKTVAARIATNRGLSGEELVQRLMQGGKTFPPLDRVTAQAAAELTTGTHRLSRRTVRMLHEAGVKIGTRYPYVRKEDVAGTRRTRR